MKKLFLSLLLILTVLPALSQEKPKRSLFPVKRHPKVEKVSKYPDSYLDTVNLSRKLLLNDYAMIGVEYGVSRNSMIFTPRFMQQPVFFPEYFGITYTHYGQLVGLPVVGLQIGAFYGHEGYEFKVNDQGFVSWSYLPVRQAVEPKDEESESGQYYDYRDPYPGIMDEQKHYNCNCCGQGPHLCDGAM